MMISRCCSYMPDYAIYGGSLRSEIPFPFLPAGAGEPQWHVRRADEPPPAIEGEPVGHDQVGGSLGVQLFRHADGYRLVYDDTGTFDIDAGGARIDAYVRSAAPLEAVQFDLLGRVIPMALHAAGQLCLHGSAVHLNDGGIVFLAPKYHGKSTLAQALVRVGARLVTDDVAAINLDSTPHLRGGVPHVRLWRDSARVLCAPASENGWGADKILVEPAERVRIAHAAVPISALYILTPVRAAPGIPAITRERAVSVAATLEVLPHARLAPLLGRSEAGALLDRVARLTRTVPVHILRVVRDFGRIGEVVEQLLDWHGGAPESDSWRGAST